MDSKLLTTPSKDAFVAVPEEDQRITKEKIKALLPRGTSVRIGDDVMDIINNMGKSVDLPQNLLEEELMSYMHILGTVKGSNIKELINAMKYCNLKRNYNNQKAWSIVFPHKFDKLIRENKAVDNHVSMYNGRKLVQAIDREMLIPASLQYAPYFHAAVKKQFEIMSGNAGVDVNGDTVKVSAMVMHLAAKELAMITKQPEESKLSITHSPGEEALGLQKQMNDQVAALVAIQRDKYIKGCDIVDVQKIGIDFNELKRD